MGKPLRQFLPVKRLSLPLSLRPPNRVFHPQAGRLLPLYPSAPLLVWMLLRWCQILRRARRATPAPLFLNQMAAATILQTKLPNHVRIKFTDRPFSPAVYGLFRPIILFPIALANRLSPAQLRAVLLHEVFHLKRADVWVNLVQTLLQIAYWWHPLLWLANARIRRLREEAVDDCVMLALSDEADTYAPTLLEVAKMTLQRPLASLGFVGIVESRRSLRHRIERLLNFRKPNCAGLTLQSLAGIFAFSALSLPMSQVPERPRQPLNGWETVANPWPDPRFSGHFELNLEVNFFSAESSAVQVVFPSLMQNNRPLVIGSNDLAAIQADLERANVRTTAQGDLLRCQKFSGGRYHYRVGGVTNNSVNYETRETGERVETIGARIELVSALLEWTPMELTLLPLIDDESIRCQMELTSAEKPGVPERTEAEIPPGGAVLWAASEEIVPGKCQLVFLTRSTIKAGVGQNPGTGPPPGRQPAASELAPLRTWIESHMAKRGTVSQTNPAVRVPDADSRIDSQNRSDLYRGPAGPPATGRQAILSKLESIRLDKSWNGLPLSEVIQDLRTESKQRDPKKRGINFIFDPNVYPGTWVDPTTGLPAAGGAPAEPAYGGATRITINPPLNDVRLIDLLDAIVKCADQRIKYSIEDYAVVFSMVTDTPPLFTRTFKIDLETMRPGLREAIERLESVRTPGAVEAGVDVFGRTNETARALSDLWEFLLTQGVDFSAPGKSMFYGGRERTLLVRGTLWDLEIIELALQALYVAPPQINIKAKVFEVDESAAKLFKAQHEINSNGQPVATRAPMLTHTNGSPEPGRTNTAQHATKSWQLTPTSTLKASGVDYSLDSGSIVATNGVVVNYGGVGLKADTIKLDQQSGEAFAEGNVILQREDQVWTGDRLRYNFKTHGIEAEQFHTNEPQVFASRGGLHTNDQQVNLKVKFVEIDDAVAAHLWDWLPAQGQITVITNNASKRLVQGTVPADIASLYGNLPLRNSVERTLTSVLSNSQFHLLFRVLEQHEGVDLLTESSVTTLSGRQTQIQILEYAAVVTNWTLLPSSTGTNLFQTQNVPIGPIVDITPDVSADGLSIGLRLVGTETKFFGYDDPGQLEPNAMAAFPLPHFRFRQLTASEEVPDGQTLLLMGLVDEADIKKLRAKVPVLGDIPVLDRLFRSESTASLKKHLLIFVTPTLIDPAGNRIHREHNDSPALK